jgi:cytosine deaminase
MCAGTIVQFNIPKVVVGEAVTFVGAREFMEQHGVAVVDLNDQVCIAMMQRFIQQHPELWHEDTGEL